MANKSLKKSLIKIPVIGYAARLINDLVHLPKIHDEVIKAHNKANVNEETLRKLSNAEIVLNNSIDRLRLAHDSLEQEFSLLEPTKNDSLSTTIESSANLFANDHTMDSFYANFEDRFRGTEDMIIERLKEYLPYFKNSRISFAKTPVLDIGSGRGEFLQLLKDNKIKGLGLDINHTMVKRSNKKSLSAVQGDATSFLQNAKPQSYGAITGFHLVEHIPFNTLFRIFKAAYRSLVIDGFVIFETPNPENLIVGSTTFYLDPSHLNPIPPELLAFALENCGFKNVEILRIHPKLDHKSESLNKEVSDLFFGPQDYAIIGYK